MKENVRHFGPLVHSSLEFFLSSSIPQVQTYWPYSRTEPGSPKAVPKACHKLVHRLTVYEAPCRLLYVLHEDCSEKLRGRALSTTGEKLETDFTYAKLPRPALEQEACSIS